MMTTTDLGGQIGAALLIAVIACLAAAAHGAALSDLPIQPERRCSDYDRKRDYSAYPATAEIEIAARAGYSVDAKGWLDKPFASPYKAGVLVRSVRDTDIEHIVAAAEAHDSGLCAQPPERRRAFSRDPDNLTMAMPSTNRWEKGDRDAAGWMPEINVCWFARTVVRVKARYALSVDQAEHDALAAALGRCP